MLKPAAGSSGFVFQRSLAKRRFALLYGAGVLQVLVLVLTSLRLPMAIQPAAMVGLPVAMLVSVALIFVLLVLVSPSVPGSRKEALEQSLGVICDPALAVDPEDGEILAMNGLAAEVFGDPEELLGAEISRIAGEAPNQDLQADVLAFTNHEYERIGYYTVRLARARTRQLPVTARLGNVFNHDTVVLVFRADEVDRALADFARVQERLMSNISHELRTPLNVVMGFSEMMEDGTMGEMSEGLLDAAREIHQGGVRMLNVVDDVLDIGRARNYGLDADIGQIDVGGLAKRVRDLVAGTARREHVKLAFHAVEDLPPAYADERTLKQVLYHLTLGAIDRATPDGTVDVEAEVSGEAMSVRVSNTGKGLSEEDADAIASPPDDVPIGAEGLPMVLGMRLAGALAGRMDTRLEVETSDDGAAISFVLPLAGSDLVG